MKRVGVGIIGYGYIGKVHAFSHRSIPFHYDPAPVEARLVGVATSRPETAEAARVHGGFEMATTDWRELVDRPDIQVIHICTPNRVHAEQLVAAMAAGKHIYCDKPLTASAEELPAVRRAMAAWKGLGQMTFQYRFIPALMRARQLTSEGFLGRVISLRGSYLHAGSIDPGAAMKWRYRKVEGGGVLLDMGAHLLDLADWLAGPITAIRADARILHAERPDGRGGTGQVDVEDQVVMTVRLADGGLGSLEASKISAGAEDDLRLEITGERGAIRFSLMDPDFLETYSLADPAEPLGGSRGWKRVATIQRYPAPAVFPPGRSTSGWLRSHAACLHAFLCSVAEERQGEPSLARGVAVQRMMDRAARAAETGTWLEIERE
jgi:predicted dehydrogenase